MQYSCKKGGILNPWSSKGINIIAQYIVNEVLGEDELKKYGNFKVKITKLHIRKYKNTHFGWFKKSSNDIKNYYDYYICLCFNETYEHIVKVFIIPNNLFSKNAIWISDTNLNKFEQCEIDPSLYDEVYQNIDIFTLPEFKNLDLILENV